MTYGYDSTIAFSEATAGIDDFALDLLNRLDGECKTPKVCYICSGFFPTDTYEERVRPIVFVFHSMGGLIFKQVRAFASPLMCPL